MDTRPTPERPPAPYTEAAPPPADDLLLVPRSALVRLHAHISSEQERFPARKLRQALQIVRAILGGPKAGR